jgi:hypothetical protein
MPPRLAIVYPAMNISMKIAIATMSCNIGDIRMCLSRFVMSSVYHSLSLLSTFFPGHDRARLAQYLRELHDRRQEDAVERFKRGAEHRVHAMPIPTKHG